MTSTVRHVLALDLKDEDTAIAEYERHHQPGHVWPEVIAGIRRAGIREMSIFRVGVRLVMIIEADGAFSFERKARDDASSARVSAWEVLMDNYQSPLPGSAPGRKWALMSEIFKLSDHPPTDT